MAVEVEGAGAAAAAAAAAGEEEKALGMEWRDDKDEDVVGWFEGVAENAGLAQTQTLRRIVERNIGAEYLQRWLGAAVEGRSPSFSSSSSSSSLSRLVHDMDAAELEALYRASVPLASHADLDPYIQRIADGDSSPLLTQQPITMLSLSSGTTDGKPKYVPFTRFNSRSTLQIFSLAAAYRSRALPIRPGGRILEFIYSSKQFRTRGGIAAGTATTHYYASEDFKTKQRKTNCFTCSPQEVISAGDYKQSTYCHLLLGLVFSDQVEFVTSTFAYSIVQALATLEELWEELCEDIRDGKVGSRVTLPKVRKAVLESMGGTDAPNPALAVEIEKACEGLKRRGWWGVIPELWPNAKYVYSIMTGSMQPYLTKLRHYAGRLRLVCADYGSTESWIGVNLDPLSPPERASFTVVPTFAYFEFIPLYKQQQLNGGSDGALQMSDDFVEGTPLPLTQVSVGQQYEVVLTTCSGLYRYRLGDVVEVAGFYRGTPQLTFVCRRKLILTVNIDKNTERDLQLVVEKGCRLLGQESRGAAELVDFTSHAQTASHPGHYVIYWEVKGRVEDAVLEVCCREMDAAFVDAGYVVSRRTNSIGPLELRVVAAGTFSKILEHYIGNGAAMSQFKTPRCTRNQVLLKILDRCTVKRFRSTAYGRE